MVTVKNEFEMRKAFMRGETRVLCTGAFGKKLAEELERVKRRRRQRSVAFDNNL